jgi:serine protease Do
LKGTSAQDDSGGSVTTVSTEIASLDDSEYPVVTISKVVGPAVVGIANFQTMGNPFGRTSELTEVGSGSGFIIDSKEGFIVTNYHVIEEAEKIVVSLADGRNITGELVGGDSKTDLAVIRITADDLTEVSLGDSSVVQVGEPVVAIGNPGGQDFARSVTAGVISAVNRFLSLEGEASFKLLQTDAAINPGNSGGPLVNYQGQVIGINSAKNAEDGFEGMGFAIPISDALPTINELIEKGYAVHPGLLVSVDDRYTVEWASQRGWPAGAYVASVSSGGPAYQAGIRAGDVLTKINDVEISNSLELTHELFKYEVGDTIPVTYYRQGQTKDVKVTLVELKS